MTKGEREFVGILLFFGIVIAYAYIAAAFEQYTIWASIIFGVIVVAFVFSLVKFPNFRHFAKDATVSIIRLIAAPFTGEESKQRSHKRVPIPRETKAFVMRRAGYKCQVPGCGKQRYLRIHHIDGNRANSDASNLIVLCPNHHADADTHAFRREQLIAWRDRVGS